MPFAVTRPAAERFEELVYPDPNSGCFIWAGESCRNGYGRFHLYYSKGVRRRRVYALAHRFAWASLKGPIPAGLCVAAEAYKNHFSEGGRHEADGF